MSHINTQLPANYTLPTQTSDTSTTDTAASQQAQATNSALVNHTQDFTGDVPGANAFAARGSTLAKPVPMPSDVQKVDGEALQSGRQKLNTLREGSSVSHQALLLAQEARGGMPAAAKQAVIAAPFALAGGGVMQAKMATQAENPPPVARETSKKTPAPPPLDEEAKDKIDMAASKYQSEATSTSKCKGDRAAPTISKDTGLDYGTSKTANAMLRSERTSQYASDLALALAGLASEKKSGSPKYKADKEELKGLINQMATYDKILEGAGDAGSARADSRLGDIDKSLVAMATRMGIQTNSSSSGSRAVDPATAELVNPFSDDAA